MEEEHRAHILALPYPIRGHIAPLSNFCNTLASLPGSPKITLVHTEANLKALEAQQQQQQQQHAPAGAAAAANLHVVPISDGLPVDIDRDTEWESFLLSVQQMGPAFEALARKQAPSCIVSDPNFCWLPHTAQQLGIPLFLFVTDAAASFAITLHARRLVAEGYIGQGTQAGQSKVVDFIPGVPPLTSEFLPFPDPELVGLFFHLRVAMYDHIGQAAGVLLNTFYELEKDVIDGVRTHLGPTVPVLPVGPCLPSMPSSRSQLPDSESHCLQWLDAQAPASIVYVAFGSFAKLWNEGLYHIVAEGLRRSGQPFLWATEWAPPEAFVQDTQEQGLLVKWAPQLHVLAHRAVGAFITHCGWNSTIESIRHGVPMICMPQFLDQLTNCRLIVDQWKVGVEPLSGTLPDESGSSSLLAMSCVMQDDNVASNEVARLVRQVLLEEEGRSLRKRALALCEAACKAVTLEVGSSTQNIEKLLSYDALKL